MLEILGIVAVIVLILLFLFIITTGVLILMGSVAGLDVYDHEDFDDTKPAPLLGVVSPRNHSSSKGNLDV